MRTKPDEKEHQNRGRRAGPRGSRKAVSRREARGHDRHRPNRGKPPQDRTTTGVYWGRFNPPHKGHMGVIQKLSRNWNLTVAIGSAEHRDERSNPFSGVERKRMWQAYLGEVQITGIKVVALRDGPSRSWALGNLIRKCRPDVLFLSTERSEMANLAKRRIRVIRFPRTGHVSSTLIRDSIASGSRKWRGMTGRSVAKLIVELDGIRRIKRAYGTS
ncbi:MAG: adenylyltransferase/cytidyltransferase family protein [Thermoplasmata archaeon]